MALSPSRIKELAIFARDLVRQVPSEEPDEYEEDPTVFVRRVVSLCRAYLDGENLSSDLSEAIHPERVHELKEALLFLKENVGPSWRHFMRDPILRDLESVAQVLEEESGATNEQAGPNLPPGKDELWGQWQRHESLGEGGQGVAYRAVSQRTGQVGALKVLDRERIRDLRKARKALDRFSHELQSMQRINHPCVLKVLDFDLEAEQPWLVTEYLLLGSLDRALYAVAGDTWRVLRIARDVASGLLAAHTNGIIHRDVKPRNILLRTLDQAILGDFGIAHISDATELTSTDEVVRARWYGPPESENGPIENPPPNFDVYSLGKVIYACMAGGRHYFEREDFRLENADLVARFGRPELEAVNRLLDHMIVREPGKRLQSMDKVITRIDETLGELFGCGSPDQCRVCRVGRYQEPSGSLQIRPGSGIEVWEGISGDHPKVEVCHICGDLRLSAPKTRTAWIAARRRQLS